MTTRAPEELAPTNLSHAWARAFLIGMDRPAHALAPLTLTVSEFSNGVPVEDVRVRALLDEALAEANLHSCRESAAMIFPNDQWMRMANGPRTDFYNYYLRKHLPRLKARVGHGPKGTYFERMIASSGVRIRDGKPEIVEEMNQLEHIIEIWHERREKGSRPRQSALQVACFDPAKDHTGQTRRGFPCLQQVSFVYDDRGRLALNAYYPTQYLFARAYGNYLGLCHLGHFMAQSLGLSFARLNCFISYPDLDHGKRPQESLAERLRTIIVGKNP